MQDDEVRVYFGPFSIRFDSSAYNLFTNPLPRDKLIRTIASRPGPALLLLLFRMPVSVVHPRRRFAHDRLVYGSKETKTRDRNNDVYYRASLNITLVPHRFIRFSIVVVRSHPSPLNQHPPSRTGLVHTPLTGRLSKTPCLVHHR